jgi:hypothetical protein
MDYQAVQRSTDFSDPRALALYLKSGFISRLTPDLISALVSGFNGHPGRLTNVFFQSGGGAIARVAPEATAFAQRDVMANMGCFVGWPFGQDGSEHIQWTRQYWSQLERFTYGFYVNDLNPELTADAVRANYRNNHDRLVAVKNRYDPRNLFRLNANVRPAV